MTSTKTKNQNKYMGLKFNANIELSCDLNMWILGNQIIIEWEKKVFSHTIPS